MDLQQLRYVVAVADLGNFTRAAERCFVVQSALSHQIARLEQELGARLFQRTSRRVQLTSAGQAFLPAARQCLEAADRARAEVSAATGEIRGRLSVGVIPTVAAVDVPAALRDFHDRHPAVRVGLTMGASDDLVRRVSEGAIDIAFIGVTPDYAISGVRHEVLQRDRLVAVVSPDHALASRKRIRLPQLADEVFVDFPAGTPGREQSDRAFAVAGVDRTVAFEISDAQLMARLIQQRLGIGVLPAGFAPQLPELVAIALSPAPVRVEHVVWSRLGEAPAAAAFLDQLDVDRKGR